MKKMASVLLVLSFMLVSLGGCSSGNDPTGSVPNEAENYSSVTETSSDDITEEEENAISEEEYKTSCESYAYREIARYPGKYSGKPAYFRGEVFQVMEDGDDIALMVNVTELDWIWEDSMFITYTRKSSDEARVLEDDIIEIRGDLGDLYTYETVLGDTQSVPSVAAEYINILGVDTSSENTSENTSEDTPLEENSSDETSDSSSDGSYVGSIDENGVVVSYISNTVSEEDAYEALAELVPLSEGQGFRYLGTEMMDIYECHSFALYEDTPDHIATLAYYLVDPSGFVYEHDIITGEYIPIGW